jgi:hypothetical protein
MTTRQLPPRCDFYGCNCTVCAADMRLKTGKRFCQQHSDEVATLLRNDNIPGMIAFLHSSYGPPKMATRRTE